MGCTQKSFINYKTMKKIYLFSIFIIFYACKNVPTESNNVASVKRKGDLDSTHVKVTLKFTGKIKEDGTILDPSGLEIGKSDKEGVIRNKAGLVIGKREKSLNELREAYSLPGL